MICPSWFALLRFDLHTRTRLRFTRLDSQLITRWITGLFYAARFVVYTVWRRSFPAPLPLPHTTHTVRWLGRTVVTVYAHVGYYTLLRFTRWITLRVYVSWLPFELRFARFITHARTGLRALRITFTFTRCGPRCVALPLPGARFAVTVTRLHGLRHSYCRLRLGRAYAFYPPGLVVVYIAVARIYVYARYALR